MFTQLFAGNIKIVVKIAFWLNAEFCMFFFFDKEKIEADVTATGNSLLETFCDLRRTKWDIFWQTLLTDENCSHKNWDKILRTHKTKRKQSSRFFYLFIKLWVLIQQLALWFYSEYCKNVDDHGHWTSLPAMPWHIRWQNSFKWNERG